MAEKEGIETQEGESQDQSPMDFVVDPISDEDLEDVSGGGCSNCTNGCSEV